MGVARRLDTCSFRTALMQLCLKSLLSTPMMISLELVDKFGKAVE
jgi:hypothetical protein